MSKNEGPAPAAVVAITGAGQGLGRAEALAFGATGACVVVNDIHEQAAQAVAAEVESAGGTALVHAGDITDWDVAGELVETAVRGFGQLDVLINNAGVLVDVPFIEMDADAWDRTLRVHLRGTFCPTKHAVAHWLERARASETGTVDGRIINTSSPSGLYATVEQAHYGTAKSGIATLSVILAQELCRYGITVNALAPTALTPMTDHRAGYLARLAEETESGDWNPGAPANVAALTVWLASESARTVTGHVINIRGGHVSVAENWAVGPTATSEAEWDVKGLDAVLPDLLAEARPLRNAYGEIKNFAIPTI